MDSSFKEFFIRIRFLFWLSLLMGSGFGLIILFIGNKELFLWFNKFLTTNTIVSNAAYFLSKLGEWMAMLFIVFYAFQKSNKEGLIGLVIWLTGACFSWICKLWLFAGKPRPFEYFSKQNIILNLTSEIEPNRFNTFPSGHTITAFYALFFLAFLIKDIRTWQSILFWVLAFGCGLSRIVLVQHWPIDVFAGMFMGIAAVFLVIRVSYFVPSHPILTKSFVKDLF